MMTLTCKPDPKKDGKQQASSSNPPKKEVVSGADPKTLTSNKGLFDLRVGTSVSDHLSEVYPDKFNVPKHK